MNQEMQLSNTMPAAGDYWTAGQTFSGPAGGGPTAPRSSTFGRMHRLLRGRYPVAIVLAAAGAVAGAVGGYMAVSPKFDSKGLISINPVVPTGTLNDATLPMWSMVLASETSLIQSTPVAEAAVKDPHFLSAWQKAYHGQEPPAPADFLANLTAEHEKNTPIVDVTFEDKDPGVAKAGTQAAIAAFMDSNGDVGAAERTRNLAYNRNMIKTLNQTMEAHEDQLNKWGALYGLDVTPLQTATLDELSGLQKQLDDATMAYKQAANPKGRTSLDASNRSFIIQQVAAVDPAMRQLLTARQDLVDQLDTAKITYGVNHPVYQRLHSAVQQKNDELESYLHAYLQNNVGQTPFSVAESGNGISLGLLKARMDAYQVEVDLKSKKAQDLAALHANIDRSQRLIAQDQADIATHTRIVQQLEAEQALSDNVKVISDGADAEPAANRRPIAAAAGFLFGGLIPLGIVMLYGLTDYRFRYSDDTAHADLQGVTLLGILPNLPDRLSDPQQAGVAAHCVHQIRTMLQINRSNDEPQVLAVTSAAPADGKTSLTLALGLSYAACGARTLLIDCDLVAAGLSHRLNVKSPEGVLEAVANRALLEYVRTTDIADVAILPVGITHAHHASTLSPVALRRLLSEAKKQFDIILVDTGPILGSIEASLVCAAADRTILAVARGQQRPLVERSIGHLQAIGSRLAGVVFNRAQSRDFERSMSGLALRSRPANGNGSHGHSEGAMAGSFRRNG